MVRRQGGSYLYGMMRDYGDVGPRMGCVSPYFVCDRKTARVCWFWGLWGLRSFIPIGTGLSLAPSPTGAGENGGAAALIRFRLPVDHGSVLGAELD